MSSSTETKGGTTTSSSSSTQELLVLQSDTDKRLTLHVTMGQSLKSLKDKIHQQMGIPLRYQRIFHLGRELKTGGRSLENLGIGNFGAYFIHVHSSEPTRLKKKRQREAANTAQNASATKTDKTIECINIDDEDDDEVILVEPTPQASKKTRVQR